MHETHLLAGNGQQRCGVAAALLICVTLAACGKSEPATAATRAPGGSEAAAAGTASAATADKAAKADKADNVAPIEAKSGDPTPAGEPSATLKGPDLIAKLYFTPAKPKVGEIFAVCTVVEDPAGVAIEAAAVAIDATMPSHGHGMMTEPQHRKGASCWISEGMKLHMHGPWELKATVKVAGEQRTATANWEQPPEAL